MRVGYARVSSKSQNLSRQIQTLKKDHCQKIFQEKISGATTKRPQLHKMLKFIRQNDIVEVAALDRLGRNKDDDLKILRLIKDKGARIDIANFHLMTPPVKKPDEDENQYKQDLNMYGLINSIMIQLLAYVAETERREIKERQKQGIKIAKKNGVYRGRNEKFTKDNPKVQKAFKRYFLSHAELLNMSVGEIAGAAGMSRKTFYRKFHQYEPQPKDYLNDHQLKLYRMVIE